MSDFAATPTLENAHVRLEGVDHAHAPALTMAAEEGELFRTWVTTVPDALGMSEEIDRRLGLQQEGTMAPWTVIDASTGTPVGMSTFMNIDAENRRVEIGSTWLGTVAHGTAINPAAKLLMLTRAFEELDCIAVEFRTHFHNRRSRAAIAKLGAKQDGILRNHSLFNGVLRDTVVFSIIASEWPTVRLGLNERLREIEARARR